MPLPEQLQELERRIAATVEQALAAQRGELASRLRRRESELQELIDSVAIAAPRLSAADLAPFADEGAATGRARAFTALRDAMSRLDSARTQADLLAGLLEGASAFAARSALLLAREDGLHAWAGCGFGGDGVQAVEGVTVAYTDGWAAAGSGRGTVSLDRADCARLVDHLSGPSAHDGVAIPVVLRDRVAAVVYADRLTGSSELAIAALQCLTYTATQALETLPLRPGQAASLTWATEAPAGSGLRPWDTTAVATAAALAAPEPVLAATAEPERQPEPEPAVAIAEPEPVVTSAEPEPEAISETVAEAPAAPEAAPAAAWESDWQLAAAPAVEIEAAEPPAADFLAAPVAPEPETPEPAAEEPVAGTALDVGEEPTGSWQRAYLAPTVAEEPVAAAADVASHEPQWALEATPEEAAYVVAEEESAVEAVEAPATEIWPAPPASFDSYEPTYEPTTEAATELLPELVAEPAIPEPTADTYSATYSDDAAEPELPPVVYDDVVPTPAVSAEDDRLWAPVAAAQEPLATSWTEPVADTFVEPTAGAVYAESYAETYAEVELPAAETYSEPAAEVYPEVVAEVAYAEPAWQEPTAGLAAEEAPAEELYAEVEDVTTTADIVPVAPADTHEDATVLITRPRFDRPEPPPGPELAYTERIPVGDLRSAVTPPAADFSPNATQMFARPPIEPPVVPPPEPSAFLSPAPPPGAVPPPVIAAPRPSTQVTPPAPKGDTVEVRPPEDLQGPGWAFATTRVQTVGRDPAHEEARRLARLLVSEIKLYNEELVEEGRRMRNIYGLLREDIDRSRQMYEERIDDRVRTESDYFQQELVRILAGGDAAALGT